MTMLGIASPPSNPAAPPPPVARGAIRRTSSIDIDWPAGRDGPMRLLGRARDYSARHDGSAAVVAEDWIEAVIAPDRTIGAIHASRDAEALAGLVGERAGGHLRKAIAALLPEERRSGSVLHLLLDDISGTSLIAPWAWSRWDADWLAGVIAAKATAQEAGRLPRENVCAGLRTGSSGLGLGAEGVPTGDLRDPDDPAGWHAMPDHRAPAMRRARRIDVVRRGALVRIDAAFQDSATTPDGSRAALHEYRIQAIADPASNILVEVTAEPRVLPFGECVAAATNVAWLNGTPLDGLREAVLAKLRGPEGCTHLNDALRALADVPGLIASLAAQGRGSPHR